MGSDANIKIDTIQNVIIPITVTKWSPNALENKNEIIPNIKRKGNATEMISDFFSFSVNSFHSSFIPLSSKKTTPSFNQIESSKNMRIISFG